MKIITTKAKQRSKKFCLHSYQPYQWQNFLDNTNTQGNYIKIVGGEYTSYICVKCQKIYEVSN